MFQCSVASELSKYDNCQSEFFCMFIRCLFDWRCYHDNVISDSSRNEGMSTLKVVCGKLK